MIEEQMTEAEIAETEELEEAVEDVPAPVVEGPPNLVLTHLDTKGVVKSSARFSTLEAAIDAGNAIELKKGENVTITPLVYFREEV